MSEPKSHSVLVVDDESLNIMTLSHILSRDYTVYAAKTGQAAIRAAEKYNPDIILLDIIMPEMDGYDVIAALKSSEATQNIPVIFITGLSNPDDEEKGLSFGAADYITKPFSPGIVRLRLQNQIKIFEQMRTIERLSMIDSLTGLPNRRSFDIRLYSDWGRAVREKMPISVLMVDADRFKNYNDTYGHLQGDVALQALAGIIQQTLKRPGDFTARWGGEEFVVLMSNTDSDGALDVAEQIRRNVEQATIPCANGLAVKITVSVGANTWDDKQNKTVVEFVAEADKALYRAKELGRNRVCTPAD